MRRLGGGPEGGARGPEKLALELEPEWLRLPGQQAAGVPPQTTPAMGQRL